MNLTGKRLWITGASGGIGYALAQAALAAGAQVAASGRRAEVLETLRPKNSEQLLVLAFDVCDSAATLAAADNIRQTWGGLDWLIANAGDCVYINPPQWDSAAIRHMMEINYFSVVNTAAAALPLMAKADGRGLFAATSSAAVFAPLPRGCAYGAAKAATGYFVESLRGHYPHIDFSLIHPGFVKTPLTDKNDFPMPLLMSPEKAAAIILRGLQARRASIRFPRRLIIALHCITLLPPRLQQRLLVRMLGNA